MKVLENIFEISHNHHTAILSMEGLRGLAVFLVFLVHYSVLIEPWIANDTSTHQLLLYIKATCTVGVDLFFVISGYLIYGSLIKKEKPYLVYMKRRIQRIYPTFTVVLIVYILLSYIYPSASKLPDDFFATVVLVMQNFFMLPGLFDVKAINSVSWTLSYEFFYYLTIPVVIGGLSIRNWEKKYRVLFFSLIIIGGFIYFYFNKGHVRLLTFVAGILLFEAISHGYKNKVPFIGVGAVIVSFATMIYVMNHEVNLWYRYVAVCLSFVLLCYESFTTTGVVNKFFRLKYLRWLGNMSYSYYLIHVLSMKALLMFFERLHPASSSDTMLFYYMMPIAFAGSIIFSFILYVFIEKPYSLDNKPIPFLAIQKA